MTFVTKFGIELTTTFIKIRQYLELEVSHIIANSLNSF